MTVRRDSSTESQTPKWQISGMLCLPLFWIMTITAFCYMTSFLLFQFGYVELGRSSPDSDEYIQAAENISLSHILSGDVDTLRPPVYPTMIRLAQILFGKEHAYLALIVFQYFLYFISIWFFHRIVQEEFHLSPLCSVACVTCYSLTPTLVAHHQKILSESLSISSFVIIFALISFHIRRPTYRTVVLLGFSGLYLVMLRPAFLFFVPLLFVFWFLVAVSRRAELSRHLVGLGCTIISIALILGYCHLVQKKCGIFAVTEVAIANQYMIIVQSGLYQYGADTEVIDLIQTSIDRGKKLHPDFPPVNSWISPYGLPNETYLNYFGSLQCQSVALERQAAFVTQILRDHQWKYLRYCMGKFIGVQHEVIGGRLSPQIITFQLIYFLLACEAITILLYRFRTNCTTLFRFMLWAAIAGVIVTTVLGAGHATRPPLELTEYSRLVTPAIPFVIILIFRYIDVLLSFWKTIGKTLKTELSNDTISLSYRK